MLRVVEAGLHSTIQDRGRFGWAHLGVRVSGAADALALAAANLLVGNEPEAAAVEMTLLGGAFAVEADVLVGLAGADMAASVPEESRSLSPGASYRLHAGTTLTFAAASDGARTYLAVAGGLAVPLALGSAATDPTAGLGGIEGRALRVGDRLAFGPSQARAERAWPDGLPASGITDGVVPTTLAIVPGPHLDVLPGETANALAAAVWTVSARADRVGLRLEGVPLTGAAALDLVSLPMLPGAVQLPPGGLPIVLMPDAPTVGGYPVPAVIAESDRHIAGQLRPGDSIAFAWIDHEEARRRSRARAARLRAAVAELR